MRIAHFVAVTLNCVILLPNAAAGSRSFHEMLGSLHADPDFRSDLNVIWDLRQCQSDEVQLRRIALLAANRIDLRQSETSETVFIAGREVDESALRGRVVQDYLSAFTRSLDRQER